MKNKWLDNLKNKLGNEIKKILVGNKADLEKGREVSFEEGKNIKNENKFEYFCEVSAKTGQGIAQLFEKIIEMLSDEVINNQNLTKNQKIQLKTLKYDGIKKKKIC